MVFIAALGTLDVKSPGSHWSTRHGLFPHLPQTIASMFSITPSDWPEILGNSLLSLGRFGLRDWKGLGLVLNSDFFDFISVI
jgi:hypothetical protein